MAAHKLLATLVIMILVAGLCAGGWYGWQQYQYRQSSAYAMEKLKQSLNPPDPARLAHLVDFNSLGRDMGRAGSESFPFFLAGEDQERGINHALQTGLLRKFMEPESKGPMFPEDASEEAKLQKPLELLPRDFISQLLATLTVRDTEPGSALVTAKFDHEQLGKTFTLVMAMQKTPAGWQIRHLVNAQELAEQLRSAMLERHAALRKVFQDKNAATSKAMNNVLPLQSCTANIGTLSDGRTAILIIHALARNKGDVQINNFNLDTVITGRSGQPLVRRYLNAAKPVAPGEDFNHRWSMELESNSPLAMALLHDGPLQCRAAWQTLSLNNGKVLHVVETPNPDRPCNIAGHDHPEGFCINPVFQR